MSRRRGAGASIAANPVLIGAATTLVVIVAVFLAYNANRGLPFVPTYDLKAEIHNAANIVEGNEVRSSGTRVGVIDKIVTEQKPNGQVLAVLNLKLETSVQELPVDTNLLVRPRSPLGLKYVELIEGDSEETFQNGATIPLRNATPRPVELDELFNTFDEKTREASRVNLLEFGNGFAGRGSSINAALGALGPLLQGLIPVAQNLTSRRTRLAEFFPALNRVAEAVAPVAETQGSLFRNLDTTFDALADVSRPYIQQSIERGPEALDQGIRSFRFQRGPLANAAGLFRDLRPGVAALRVSAPDLTAALVAGTPALQRSVALNTRLERTFRVLREFATNPLTRVAITDLEDTVRAVAGLTPYLVPLQLNCNYVSLFFRNAANLLSEGTSRGTWQRFIIINPPPGTDVDPNSEFGPSSSSANGPNFFLHTNPYPNVGAEGQPRECEAGNEPFPVAGTPPRAAGQAIGNPPGTQPFETEETEIDRNTDEPPGFVPEPEPTEPTPTEPAPAARGAR